jgi:hypothetical protein
MFSQAANTGHPASPPHLLINQHSGTSYMDASIFSAPKET